MGGIENSMTLNKKGMGPSPHVAFTLAFLCNK
jgi:hypothetical protein